MAKVEMSANNLVLELLNGTLSSLKRSIPISYEMSRPVILTEPIQIKYGVLIGFLGDVSGKLLLMGDTVVFGAIGEMMFGMPIQDEMLTSFTGELGNIIAGGIASAVAEKGIKTDITSPTILEGESKVSGYKKAIILSVTYKDVGKMDINLLLDY